MINWAYFPLSHPLPEHLGRVVSAFEKHADEIASETNEGQESNAALAKVADSLEAIGMQVERGKTRAQKIYVPVLFGRNGVVEKSFEADAFWEEGRFVLEVEAGRAVVNYQFLKDLFQACMMQGVDYLGIAVRNRYRTSDDFEKVFSFFDTLYKSGGLELPFEGVLIIGY